MTDIDFLRQEEVVSFILENAKTDVNHLLLNPPKIFKDRIKIIVEQVLSRQKAVGKLDSWVKRADLIFPPPVSIEQASSFTTSAYKKNLISGELLVDLTGGTGIDCLAISENFEKTIFVERHQTLCERFKNNSAVLSKKIEVRNEDAEDFLHHFDGKATFFIDPARRDGTNKKVFKLEDCSPNVKELMPTLSSKGSRALIKLSPLLDLTKTIREISNGREVHVVSVKNDCKELLLLIDFEFMGETKIHAVNLETSQEPLVFTQSDEMNTTLDNGNIATYLFEPNASILKSGAFNHVGMKYGVHKISRNTHLYSSNDIISDFPGKAFEILHENGKEMVGDYKSVINVLTRNYPLSASDLKKKYNLRDGGSHFLIGFRDAQNKSQLIIAKRLY